MAKTRVTPMNEIGLLTESSTKIEMAITILRTVPRSALPGKVRTAISILQEEQGRIDNLWATAQAKVVRELNDKE